MNWERSLSFSGPSKGGLYQCVERDGAIIENEFLDERSFAIEKAKAASIAVDSIPLKREYDGTVYTIYRAVTRLAR